MKTFGQFLAEEIDRRLPWEMPRAEYYKVHTHVQPGFSSYGEGERLSKLPAHQKLWVWHGTDSQDKADHFAKNGFRMSDKKSNLARQRYEQGEDAEYAPGRGLSHGTYVASTPNGADVGGQHLFAIRVKRSHLQVPPEQSVLGVKTGGHALASDDAVVTHRIHPKNVIYLGRSNRYRKDAHREFVNFALKNGHHVPDHVLDDYPDLKVEK